MLLAATPAALATELPEFYRGVRAMGMGNAFTAIADDYDAIFYNPAGLALNRQISFHLLNPKFDASKDDIKSVATIREAAQGLDSSTLSKMFGRNLYASGTIFPSVQIPGFAIGYYYGAQFHMVSRNLAMPRVELRYLLDKGLVTGYGHDFRGISRRHSFRAGVGLKWLSREGYDGTIPFSRLASIDASYLKSLVKGPETGWGVDVGFQYELPLSGATDLIVAMAWHDIGDTKFGNALAQNSPPSIKNNMALGGAIVQRLGRFAGQSADVKFTGEARHVLQENVDPRLKTHLGAELRVSDISVQAGLNQSSLGGGVALDLGFFKVSAVTYGVDDMSYAFMERERRYMVQFDFKLDVGGKEYRTRREDDRRKHPRDYR